MSIFGLQFTFSHQLSRKWAAYAIAFGLFICATIGSLSYYQMWPMTTLNHFFYDNFQQYSAVDKAITEVVIVDIDDASLETVGQWPWPRYKVATLIQMLSHMEPAAIGVDIIFAEEDRMSLANIQKVYQKDFNLDINLDHVPKAILDNDGYLGAVLAETGAVGAHYLYFDYKQNVEVLHQSQLQVLGKVGLLTLHDASGILNSTFKIASQQKFTGFINAMPDEDGMLRRLPLLIQYEGAIYPHLALATLMRASGVQQVFVDEGHYGVVLRVGKYSIPITPDGFMMLNFSRLPHAYTSVSALEVLNGSLEEGFFQHKIVFIGSSAAGLKDLHHTVLDAQFPAVKTHAVMIDNVKHHHALVVPRWAGFVALMVCIWVTIMMLALFVWSGKSVLQLSITLLVTCLILIGSWVSVEYFRLLLYPSGPVLTILLLYIGLIVMRFMDEKEARIAIEKTHWQHLESTAQELEKKVKDQTKLLLAAKEKAEQEARVDILTGLTNRRAFTESAHRFIARISRLRSPALYFFMIDIDFFKKVNDTYGHAAGDVVLVRVAKVLTEHTREVDEVFRLGGEEFGLLMNSEEAEGAVYLAEQLRQAVENLSVCFEGQTIRVTISTGVAKWVDNSTLDSLMNRADEALYRAKEQGRNQSILDAL